MWKTTARRCLLIFAAALAATAGCGVDPHEPWGLNERLRADEPYGVPAPPPDRMETFAGPDFNDFIMNAAKGFGAGNYLWEGDGVTRKITYQGETIATPYGTDNCHCVGATLQVYMTAFAAWDAQYNGGRESLRGLTVDQVKRLKKIWFVATDALEGAQAALSQLELGRAVTAREDARPGDPTQIWRNNDSGHSVIFDSWVRSGGEITGIKYFSCNSGGPGFATENIGSGARDVTPGRIHIGRPLSPSEPPDAGVPEDATAPRDAGGVEAGPTPPDAWPRTDGRRAPVSDGCCAIAGDRREPPIWALALLGLLAVAAWRRRRGEPRR